MNTESKTAWTGSAMVEWDTTTEWLNVKPARGLMAEETSSFFKSLVC